VSHFEDELRSALRRKEPPPGFAARVLARTTPPRRMFPMRLATAAIAAVLVLSAGGYGYREYQGRRAKQQLLVALEITSSKLALAQNKIDELNQRIIHE
jgi:uncharacterized protein HemX